MTRRFIPAGAGNSGRVVPDQRHAAVHPRWRGEQGARISPRTTSSGSSPLARGTGQSGPLFATFLRFIPAGAGNSRRRPACLSRPAVHPRWRGEQEAIEGHRHGVAGSSPLARGTAGHRAVQRARQRFIPAGAGNSAAGSSAVFLSAVHPRWRGEQPPHAPPPAQLNGSSPLARGTAN